MPASPEQVPLYLGQDAEAVDQQDPPVVEQKQVAKAISRQAVLPALFQAYDSAALLLNVYFLSQASQADFLASGLMYSAFDWAMITEYPLSAARGIFAEFIAKNADDSSGHSTDALKLGRSPILNNMVQQNRLLGLLIGILPTTILIFFTKNIFISFGVRAELAATASEFTQISAFAVLFMLLRAAEYNFLYAANKSKLISIAMFTETTTGIVLNALLVPGYLGMKSMGAKGAGIAMLIKSLTTNLLLLIASIIDKDLRYYSILHMRKYLTNLKTLKKIFFVGLPILFTSGMANISELIRNILIGSMSNAEIAISQAYMSYSYVITSAGYVFATVGGVHVAKFLGLNNFKAMYYTAYTSLALNTAIVLPFILISYLVGLQITRLFVDDETIQSHKRLIQAVYPIVFTANTVYGAQNSINEALKNVQDTALSAIITVVSYLFFGLFLAYESTHHFDFGLVGLETSYTFAFLANAILFTLYWRHVGNAAITTESKPATSNERCYDTIKILFSRCRSYSIFSNRTSYDAIEEEEHGSVEANEDTEVFNNSNVIITPVN